MKMIGLTLSAVGLTAVAMSGCNNAPNQSPPGQTPTTAAAPGPNVSDVPNNSTDAFSIKLIGQPGAP
jgi:hypothetical protein